MSKPNNVPSEHQSASAHIACGVTRRSSVHESYMLRDGELEAPWFGSSRSTGNAISGGASLGQ